MAVESVAGCAWNGWSDHRGIGGQMLMEWVVGWPWNPHQRVIKPDVHVRQQRAGSPLPHCASLIGRLSANFRLDGV